jgi:phage gp36-like protein
MPYCTQADILEQISLSELIQFTDDSGLGAVDASVVERAIADADAEIDSYAAVRYPVPFAPVPAMIRKTSVEMAVYNIFARRRGATPARKERYDNAIRFLRSVAKGEVSIGSDAPAESAADGIEASTLADDKIFTPDKMSGF